LPRPSGSSGRLAVEPNRITISAETAKSARKRVSLREWFSVNAACSAFTLVLLLVTPYLVPGTASAQPSGALPHVVVQTELGDIEIEVDVVRAPNTAANFLKYVDAKHFEGGMFHRTVKMDNQPDNAIKIEVIQAGVNPDRAKEGFGPILLER